MNVDSYVSPCTRPTATAGVAKLHSFPVQTRECPGSELSTAKVTLWFLTNGGRELGNWPIEKLPAGPGNWNAGIVIKVEDRIEQK